MTVLLSSNSIERFEPWRKGDATFNPDSVEPWRREDAKFNPDPVEPWGHVEPSKCDRLRRNTQAFISDASEVAEPHRSSNE